MWIVELWKFMFSGFWIWFGSLIFLAVLTGTFKKFINLNFKIDLKRKDSDHA